MSLQEAVLVCQYFVGFFQGCLLDCQTAGKSHFSLYLPYLPLTGLKVLSPYWLVTETWRLARETCCKHEPAENSCLTAGTLEEGMVKE